MNKAKRLTLEELIARKRQGEEDRLQVKEISVKSLGGSIIFQRASIGKVIDLMDSIENENSIKESYEFQKELIYMHCPIIHNKELQEAYECVEPIDIVDKLFGENIGEIASVCDEILAFYGLNDEVEKIKNS